MRYFYTFFAFLLIFTFLSCSREEGFNFNKKWTWEELEAVTNAEKVQKHITFLKKNLSQEEARFLFSTIKKIKKPETVAEFTQLENDQIARGAGFNNIIPKYFQNPAIIPIPDNFENTVALAFYLAKIKFTSSRYLWTSGIGYNPTFGDFQIKETDKEPDFLDIEINISDMKNLLTLMDNKKIKRKELHNISHSESFDNMLTYRKNNYYISNPMPVNADIEHFISLSVSHEPIHILWRWVNPMNNFGFADISQNLAKYKETLEYIDEHKAAFEYHLLSRIEKYLPGQVDYKQKIEFGVCFGLKSWVSDDYIGLNLPLMKNNYGFYYFELRKHIFSQLYSKIIIKSPDYSAEKNSQTLQFNYWNFDDEKDNEFYDLISHIHFEGLKNYVAGKPLGFDYMTQAKESRGFLKQLHNFIYVKPNETALRENKRYVLGEYGPFTGRGYLMAEYIEKEFGSAEITRCLQNGPVYFVQKFIEFQNIKNSARYNYFDEEVAQTINRLYKTQSQYYAK